MEKEDCQYKEKWERVGQGAIGVLRCGMGWQADAARWKRGGVVRQNQVVADKKAN